MDFEKRLELLMKCRLHKIRQSELAQICNCSSSWISQWFSGKIEISQDMQIKIINYINSK